MSKTEFIQVKREQAATMGRQFNLVPAFAWATLTVLIYLAIRFLFGRGIQDLSIFPLLGSACFGFGLGLFRGARSQG